MRSERAQSARTGRASLTLQRKQCGCVGGSCEIQTVVGLVNHCLGWVITVMQAPTNRDIRGKTLLDVLALMANALVRTSGGHHDKT